MTVLSDLSLDEQRLLLSSLEAAAIVVSTSSPGRQEETASEGFAVAEHILKSQGAYVANTLVSSTILALKARVESEERFPDYVDMAMAAGARERADDTLREAAALLDAKATPEEAAGFKAWLLGIAEVTARAGKEDQGFLGRGGVMVNEAERGAVREVAATLGIDAAPADPVGP